MSNLTFLPGNGQKSPPVVKVLGNNVQLIEYKDKPVITLRIVDELHQKEDSAARKSFNRHRERFIEGEDFFKIPYDEYSKFLFVHNEDNRSNVRVPMIFLTESGYLMAIKPFTDDLSWKVQRELVNNYFAYQRVKEHISNLADTIPPEPEVPKLQLTNESPFPDIPDKLIELAREAKDSPYIAALLKKAGIEPEIKSAPIPVDEEDYTHELGHNLLSRFPDILRATDISEIVGVSSQIIAVWVRQGRFKGYVEPGSPIRISKINLKRWACHERHDDLKKLTPEISQNEAAKFLVVSKRTIFRAIKNNVIQATKNGLHYRIKTSSLANMMKESRHASK